MRGLLTVRQLSVHSLSNRALLRFVGSHRLFRSSKSAGRDFDTSRHNLYRRGRDSAPKRVQLGIFSRLRSPSIRPVRNARVSLHELRRHRLKSDRRLGNTAAGGNAGSLFLTNIEHNEHVKVPPYRSNATCKHNEHRRLINIEMRCCGSTFAPWSRKV